MFDPSSKSSAEIEALKTRVRDAGALRVARAEAEVNKTRSSADEGLRIVASFADRLENIEKERSRFATFETWFDKMLTQDAGRQAIRDCASFMVHNCTMSPQAFSQVLAVEFCRAHRDEILSAAKDATLGTLQRSFSTFLAAHGAVLKRHGCIE